MNKRDKIALAIFVFVTLTAGTFGYMLDQVLTDQPEGNSLGMGLWLVLPLLTGIVLRIINKDLKEIGARTNFRNNMKWYGVAVLVYPFIMLISIIIAKAGGGLTIGKFESGALFALMLTTFFGSCIKNIFEEFAWRGCLVPYLEKAKMNDWLLYFTSGLVWGMWHITYYMFFLLDEYFTETSRPMMVVIGIVLMIFWSPLFVELRRLTNSVWPCVILHAMEDAVPTLLFVTTDVFRIKKSLSIMIDPISGFITTAILLLIGLSLRRYRIKKNYVIGAE